MPQIGEHQNALKVKEEIEKFTILVGDLNTPLSVFDKSKRYKISMNIDDLNYIINQHHIIVI